MNCPKCGVRVCLCQVCGEAYSHYKTSSDGVLFLCKGCNLLRPLVWWEALQLDINTEIKFEEPQITEEIPEEFAGTHEHPWGD